MRNVTTITLQFKLTHGTDENTIGCVRSLIGKLRDCNADGEVEVVNNVDTGDYTFIKHDGTYSHQFKFKTIDEFVLRYARLGASELASVLSEYGQFVDCESDTKEVKDEAEG